MDLKYIKVDYSENHIKILFKQLSERKFNISHNKMPNLYSHRKFVMSHPYREWFIVQHKDEYIGSFYIQEDNSISIKISSNYYAKAIRKIIDFIKNNFLPRPAIKSKVSKEFYINAPFLDEELKHNLEKIGYQPIQISYPI